MNLSASHPQRESTVFTMYEAVQVILEDIPAKLVEYFNNNMTTVSEMNILLQNHLKKWIQENRNTSLLDSYPEKMDVTEPTLFNTVFCELSTVLSQNSETEAYNKFKEIVRGRKKYLYNQLREEIGELPLKPHNCLFMKNEWDALNSPYIIKNMGQVPGVEPAFLKGTLEEFMAQRFLAATEWYKKKDSYLIEFPYYEMLKHSRKLGIFLIDLTNSCLSIIYRDYYRSRSGFVTGTLDTRLGLKDTSIFSWQANSLDLKYEVSDGLFKVYEAWESSPNNTLKAIVYEEPFDPSTRNIEPEQLFARIKDDISNGQQYRTFDTFDATIITAILNNFSVASLHDKSLHINLLNLAYDVYGDTNIRADKCERLIRHIIKLGRTRISNVSTTDNGLLLGGGNITFFEYKFQVMSNASLQNENIITTINMASGDTKIDYSKLTLKDYASMELVFFLSNYMYTLWNNNIHTYISSTLYRQIESSKGRVLMQLLQEERLRIYPELEAFVPFATFRSQLKVSAKMDRFKKEVAAELNNLKTNGVAIQDYEILSNGVHLVFHPLSVAEKTIYKL